MKLRALIIAGLAGLSLAATGCDKKPAEPTATEPAVVTAPAIAPEAPAVAEAAGNAEKTVDEGADPHAGCGAAEAHAAEAAGDCAGDKTAEGGCGHGEGEAAGAIPVAAPGEPMHVGAAFTIEAEQKLGEVLAAATEGETNVRITGTIAKVCQKKGCWLVVRDGDMEARIIMKDYAFVVPKDSAGKTVSVEGSLKVKVFSEGQAKHLAEDGGEDPKAVVGEKKEFLLTATAITIGG